MNLEEILVKEPRLIPILNGCYIASTIPSESDRERMWYKVFKKRMSDLVGFGAENPELGSPEIYDLVYKTMIDILKV